MGRLSEHFHALLISRRVGWRRPWNIGAVTLSDEARIDDRLMREIETALCGLELTAQEHAFIEELLHADTLRLLVTQNKRTDSTGVYDAYSLSFGRRVSHGFLSYDRLDLIFERKHTHKGNAPLQRVSIFVSPYEIYIKNEFTMLTPEPAAAMQALYETLLRKTAA